MNNKKIEELEKELKEINEELTDKVLVIYNNIELTQKDLDEINEKRKRIFDIYEKLNEEIGKGSN